MGLEELTFDVEGVKVLLKPELHLYHNHTEDEPFLGSVPVRVYTATGWLEAEQDGFLRYDTGKKIFITALSDFIPTDSNNTELLEKYAQGMSEVARVYSLLRKTKDSTTSKSLITERNFYKNSKGEWKDIGNDWLGVYREDELRKMADAVE